jgi:hypothetical protein
MKNQNLSVKMVNGTIYMVSLSNRWCSAAMIPAGAAATRSIKNAMDVDA